MTIEEKRRAKFPNTNTFQYHNANPKNKVTSDCVIRAITEGTKKEYNEVVMELAEFQCKTGYDTREKKGYGRYLESLGWTRCKQPKKDDGTKYTGNEFCELLNTIDRWGNKRIIASIGAHHLVAITPMNKGGQLCRHKIYDTWNSGRGCVGVYYVYEGGRNDDEVYTI